MVPEIAVDDFSPEIMMDVEVNRVFFLTSCGESLEMMLESDFLFELEKSDSWQLIVPNLVFAYIEYKGNVKEIPSDLVKTLKDTGKIIVLQTGIPFRIPLLSKSEGQIVTATCIESTLMGHRIKLDKTDKGVSKGSTMIGEKAVLGENLVDKFRTVETEEIVNKLAADSTLQYELRFNSSDTLVDLWYLKFLGDFFKLKTHVTKEYAAFVKEVMPELEDSLSSDNSNGECRFHYDCCQYTSNEDCLPGKEWALEFEVEVITFGSTDDTEGTSKSYQLPFIHV